VADPSATDPESDAVAESTVGPRGWVLVGTVVLATVVVPGVVYLVPALSTDAGLPFLVAMLVLPMLPAVLLGVVAVWTMSAATDD